MTSPMREPGEMQYQREAERRIRVGIVGVGSRTSLSPWTLCATSTRTARA